MNIRTLTHDLAAAESRTHFPPVFFLPASPTVLLRDCCRRILTSRLSLSDTHLETRAERDSGKCSSGILLPAVEKKRGGGGNEANRKHSSASSFTVFVPPMRKLRAVGSAGL